MADYPLSARTQNMRHSHSYRRSVASVTINLATTFAFPICPPQEQMGDLTSNLIDAGTQFTDLVLTRFPLKLSPTADGISPSLPHGRSVRMQDAPSTSDSCQI